MKKNLFLAILALVLAVGLFSVFSMNNGKNVAFAEAAEATDAPAEETAEEIPQEAAAEDAEEPAATETPQEEAAEENPVLATYDGQEITKADVDQVLLALYNNSYVTNLSDYATGLQYLINNKVLDEKISELGLNQFTAEEEEALAAEAQTEWDSAVDTYVSYYLTEDTEEARAAAREAGDAYYRANGFSPEQLTESLKESAAYDRLEEYMMQDKDVNVTEEEIRQVFEEYAAQHQAMYEGNVSLYEMYQNMYGATSWYMPEGYRGVTHILLSVDDALLTAYQEAQAAFEESVTEEAPDGDAALKAARDEAKAAVIASKQSVIDDIYARLEKGEDFASLIREYGEDPGMTEERMLVGYDIHKDSIIYDSAFTEGAFSEKMLNPGDTSDPVVGSYGIHIIHYLRDIPGGMIEMTDEISAEIETYLKNQKMSNVFSQTVDEWTAQHEVTYFQEIIDALMNAGEAQSAE